MNRRQPIRVRGMGRDEELEGLALCLHELGKEAEYLSNVVEIIFKVVDLSLGEMSESTDLNEQATHERKSP